MPNPDFLLHEAIHIRARLEALSNYDGNPKALAADIARRESEMWDDIRHREHATRLYNKPPPR